MLLSLFSYKTATISSEKGFTLLEMLLVVAIISILSAISIPVARAFMIRNDVDVARNIIVTNLKRAQLHAQAVNDDAMWGVHVQSGMITLFQGTDYASRDSNFDEEYDIASTIVPSGLTEVSFTKLDGEPSTTGTIILTSTTGDVRNITINEKGMVDY